MITLVKQDKEFEQWADRNQELFLTLLATLGLIRLRATYKLVNVHYAVLLAARIGVEAAGIIIAEQIDGASGVQAWKRYSNRVFSMDDLGIIPDPLAIIDSIAESEMMIREHYEIDKAVSQGIRKYNPTTFGGRGNLVKTTFFVTKKVFDRGITKLGFYTR